MVGQSMESICLVECEAIHSPQRSGVSIASWGADLSPLSDVRTLDR